VSIYPRIAHTHAHATVAHHAHAHAASAADVRRAVLILATVHQDPAAAGLRVEDVLVAGFGLAKIVHCARSVGCRTGAIVMGLIGESMRLWEWNDRGEGWGNCLKQKSRADGKRGKVKAKEKGGDQAAMA
jgi:hypothetical protein